MLKAYLPSIIFLLFGFIAIRIPTIAIFLVSTGCFTFATIYALMVYRIRKAKEQYRKYQQQGNVHVDVNMGSDNEFSHFQNMEQPSFRQVSTFILKNGKWTKED